MKIEDKISEHGLITGPRGSLETMVDRWPSDEWCLEARADDEGAEEIVGGNPGPGEREGEQSPDEDCLANAVDEPGEDELAHYVEML